MRPVALVFLAGCELVFRLDDRSPEPDGPVPQVTGTFVHRVATYGSDSTIQIADLAASEAVVQVRFDNGETAQVEIDAAGRFAFDKLSERYVLSSSLDVGQELIETSDTLTLVNREAGRTNFQPLTGQVTIQLPAPTTVARELVTLGQWSNRNAIQTSVLWGTTGGSGGLPLGLLDGNQGDLAFLVDFGDDLRGNVNLRSIRGASKVADVTMVNDKPLDLRAIPPSQLDPEDSCVTLQLELGADRDAFVAAIPGAAPPAGAFALLATPSIETGFVGAANLVSTTPLQTTDVTTNLQIRSVNPYPDHDEIAVIVVGANRTVMLANSSFFTVTNSFTRAVPVDKGMCPENTKRFESLAPALAVDFTVGTTLLDMVDREIPIARPMDTVVSWKASGDVDVFDVTLFEVIEQGGLKAEFRRQYRTRQTEVAIAETLLLPNHRYVIEVRSILSFPNASNGDYATLEYPINNAATVSLPFVAR